MALDDDLLTDDEHTKRLRLDNDLITDEGHTNRLK